MILPHAFIFLSHLLKEKKKTCFYQNLCFETILSPYSACVCVCVCVCAREHVSVCV